MKMGLEFRHGRSRFWGGGEIKSRGSLASACQLHKSRDQIFGLPEFPLMGNFDQNFQLKIIDSVIMDE